MMNQLFCILIFLVNTAHEPVAGFNSYWLTDPARTYRTAFDNGKTYGHQKSARPVLVNIWYPAKLGGTAMTHQQYLEITPDDALLKPLAKVLVDYNRNVICQELLGIELKQASEAQKQVLDKVLQRQTGCFRQAPPAARKFPLVIYHSGAGSSFEDNAQQCEELARQGYVVMGSAFQRADGSSFNVDPENAGRDFEFLLRHAASLDMVDMKHVGLIGHSAGAHASLIYAARAGVTVDAIVSLDTTQDYVTMADPRWNLLVDALTRGQKQFKTPVLFAAGPTALFELADSLDQSERVYLTIPGLDHNDYISQGVWAATIVSEQDRGNANKREKAAEVRKQNRELQHIVELYLAAKLKGDEQAWMQLQALQQNLPGKQASVEIMPAGCKTCRVATTSLTPRMLFLILREKGITKTVERLQQADKKDVFLNNPYMAFNLLYYLSYHQQPEAAQQLFEAFLERGVDCRSALVAQAEMCASLKRHPAFVENCVRLGQIIGGNDKKVDEMVRKYSNKNK